MGKGQGPTPEELKFVYDLLTQGYSDSDVLAKYEELAKHGKLGGLPHRQDIRFMRQRRKEFEAARKVLYEQVRAQVDPLLAQVRNSHWEELARVAEKLRDELSIPHLGRYWWAVLNPDDPMTDVWVGTSWISREDDDPNEPVIAEDIEPILFKSLFCHLEAESLSFRLDSLVKWKARAEPIVRECRRLTFETFKQGIDRIGMDMELVLSDLVKWSMQFETFDFLPYLINDIWPKYRQMCEANGVEDPISSWDEIWAEPFREVLIGERAKRVTESIKERNTEAKAFTDILTLVVHRKTFQGTCPICASWGVT